MKLQVIAAALAATPSALGDLCSAGDKLLTIENTYKWCTEGTGGGNAKLSLDACCAGGDPNDANRRLLEIASGTEVRALQEPECRSIMTDKSYCDGDERCEMFLGSGDVMTLGLEMTSLGEGDSCCKSCTCFGDPECTSFDGKKDEWIICDGRNENTCVVTEFKCNNKKDHKKNKCKYIKDTPAWISFDESGSPCQADWATSGYAEMVMYSAGNNFEVLLFLGERGIIVDMQVTLNSGQVRTLNAKTCSWSGGSIPSSWESKDIFNKDGVLAETVWNIDDSDLGIFITAACTSAVGSSNKRIDVDSLIETVDNRAGASGFCIAGNITEKGGPRLQEKLMHQQCLAENLPKLLVACKNLVDETCQENDIDGLMEKYCEFADLQRATVGGVSVSSVAECKQILLNGSNKERTAAWTEMVCSINQDNIEQCTALISQFGWTEYLATKSTGADFGDGTSVANPSCRNSVSAYSKRSSSDSCQEGVSVEYFADGTWKESFFIPALEPPCGPLSITAETHKELFMYPVRVAQCDLNPTCLIENDCRQAQGVEVAIDFATEECPCPDPVIAGTETKKVDLYESYTTDFEVELEGQVCGSDSNLFQIGCGSNGVKPLKVNVKECEDADATTSMVEVLVGIQGSNNPVSCMVGKALEIGTKYDFKVTVGGGDITVTVDGVEECVASYNGTPRGGFDQCVFESAPSMTAANACVDVDVSSTGSPTPSPTCANLVEEGKQTDTVQITSAGFSSEATVTLGGVNECTNGEELNNVVRVGCEDGDDAGMIYSIDVECGDEDSNSGTAKISIGVVDSNGNDMDPIMCTVNNGLPVDEAVEITTTVTEDAEYTVMVDGKEECSGSLPSNGELKTSQEACVYESGPGTPEAYVCGLSLNLEPSVCENLLSPGKEDTPARGLTQSGYTATVGVKLGAATCGNEDANIIHLGCEEDGLFTVDTNCDGDAIVSVGIIGSNSPYKCVAPRAFGIDEEVTISAIVDADASTVRITVGDVVECDEVLPGPAKTAALNEDVCVYTSAPGRPEAHACEVNSVFVGQGGPCDCVDSPEGAKICDDAGELSMGTCAECCPEEESTVVSDREPVCRSLTMQQPYCDLSLSSEKNLCPKLQTNNGNGRLKLNLKLETDTTKSCCHNCICYGDPECENFYGVESKWILCDGREEETCKVTEEVCVNEKDHTGAACTFHPEIAALLENNRADIGAYGSPCLADFSTEAWMTMYNVDDFQARISMGERGVIEKLELTVDDGTYTLIADECFEATQKDLDAAWEYDNSIASLTSALDITMFNGPGQNERTLEITDPKTKIFIRAVCIKQTSMKNNPRVTSYRLNINNLVETDASRALAARDASDSGYCAQSSGEIDTGESTTANTDAIYEDCLMGLPDAHLLCKVLWSPSCTNEQVSIGVERWCQNANLLSKTVSQCTSYIGSSATKWEDLYCESVSSQRDVTMGLAQWKKNCKSELATAGYFETVRAYGTGTFFDERDPTNHELCGASTSSYSKQADSCVPGVFVETLNGNKWEEEFFIPVTLPPCGGSLEISAKDHYNLFTRPVRFRQCEIDAGSCSIDASCLPMYELGMTYEYTQSNSVCPNRRLLRGD